MIAILVPGQGRPSDDLLNAVSKEAAHRYDFVSRLLGKSLSASHLNDHVFYSAILTANALSNYERFSHMGGGADVVAGYSVGQFAALCIAGVVAPEDCIRLVVRRAQLMEQHVRPDTGMLSILGLKQDAIRMLMEKVTFARELSDGYFLDFSNFNSEYNHTIAGHVKLLNQLSRLALDAGAKKAELLPLKGAWHSRMLHPAREAFAASLESVPFSPPRMGFVDNTTGQPVDDPDEIKRNLVNHLVSPVRWYLSIRTMLKMPVRCFIECGAGSQLRQLLFFIDRRVPCHPMNSTKQVEQCAALRV